MTEPYFPFSCAVGLSPRRPLGWLPVLLSLAVTGLAAQTPSAGGDLRITEFMADPTPPVGLPNAEYVEIYNAGDDTLDLSDLRMASGGAAVPLDGGDAPRLAPGDYALLLDRDDAPAFAARPGGRYLGRLPGLTNGGDEITLFLGDSIVAAVNYTAAWYNDPARDDGGYSLEFTGGADPDCGGNWRASTAAVGGTPGAPNATTGQPADRSFPAVLTTSIEPTGITVIFSEEVVGPPDFLFLVDGDSGRPVTTTDGITFRIAGDFTTGRRYALTVLPDYSDCAGNAPTDAAVRQLAIPEIPRAGDVVINEILFNPGPGGSDFVELYNCSERLLDLQGWHLRNGTAGGSNAARTITESFLLPPATYVAITPDRPDLLARFPGTPADRVLEHPLPSLPDAAGNLTVLSATGDQLDAIDYREDMHSELLNPDDGVSLERLRTKAPTQDPANWFSAASAANFGTPGRENSQRRPPLTTGTTTFRLVEPVFSPDGDGRQDVLELAYAVDRPGLLARVGIFDAQGRPVRRLVRTELLGAAGTLRWDGTDGDGLRAPAGVYVLLVELFAPDGRTTVQKLVAALAR